VHFDEILSDYDKIRPDYPGELFAELLSYAETNGKNALEIGAGTGKATKPFLDAGYAVTAVELGANMSVFLREKYKGYRDFEVITSSFEDASLEENKYDLIYAASAFHWVDAEIGCPKAFRLLKDGGTFALARFNMNGLPRGGTPLYEEKQSIYEKYYYSHYPNQNRPEKITRERLLEPEKIEGNYGFADMSAYGFIDVTMRFYDAELTYTADEWVALMDTMSDHRALPEDDRAALYAGIKEVINRHGGRMDVDYIFQLYMGRKSVPSDR